jgi:hypothetical protein
MWLPILRTWVYLRKKCAKKALRGYNFAPLSADEEMENSPHGYSCDVDSVTTGRISPYEYILISHIDLKSISKEEHRCSPNVSVYIVQKQMSSVKMLCFGIHKIFCFSFAQRGTVCPGEDGHRMKLRGMRGRRRCRCRRNDGGVCCAVARLWG